MEGSPSIAAGEEDMPSFRGLFTPAKPLAKSVTFAAGTAGGRRGSHFAPRDRAPLLTAPTKPTATPPSITSLTSVVSRLVEPVEVDESDESLLKYNRTSITRS